MQTFLSVACGTFSLVFVYFTVYGLLEMYVGYSNELKLF